MGPPSPCPDPARWADLLNGTPPEKERAELTAHLDGCAGCQQAVEALTAGTGSWPDLARGLARQTPPPLTPSFLRAVEQLRGETPRTAVRAAGPDDTPIDFFSPPPGEGPVGRLGTYEVLEVLGRGGMGVVLKAFDPGLQRLVAVKVLAPQLAADPTARQRFAREGRAAAAVRHEHVVTVHAVAEANGFPYLVMEYVAGPSLQRLLEQAGPPEPKEVLRIALEAAEGLAAAHAQGLIHRDIKPSNILLEEGTGRVKLTDFGLARTADDPSLTDGGYAAGTPSYMAPEQARGLPPDHRADLFSLGSVLYALCTGRAPFGGGEPLAVLRRVCDETPRPIRALNPAIPVGLVAVIDRLHAKDPAGRFPSAADLAARLRQLLTAAQPSPAAEPEAAEPSEPTVVLPPRPAWRRRGLLAVVGLLVLVVGFALAEGMRVTKVTPAAGWLLGRRAPEENDDAEKPADTPAPPAKGNDDRPARGPDPAEAAERRLAPLAPGMAVGKPLSDTELNAVLADLQAPDAFRRVAATQRLEQADPVRRRLEVVRALQPLLNDPDHFTRQSAIRATGRWGAGESLEPLIKLFEHPDVFTRRSALAALGMLQDERAAEPVAGRLVHFHERGDAKGALQMMGPMAEKAVLPYLKHDDWTVRCEACRILGAIGTKASVPVLEAAAKNRDDFHVMLAAQEALKVLAARHDAP